MLQRIIRKKRLIWHNVLLMNIVQNLKWIWVARFKTKRLLRLSVRTYLVRASKIYAFHHKPWMRYTWRTQWSGWILLKTDLSQNIFKIILMNTYFASITVNLKILAKGLCIMKSSAKLIEYWNTLSPLGLFRESAYIICSIKINNQIGFYL